MYDALAATADSIFSFFNANSLGLSTFAFVIQIISAMILGVYPFKGSRTIFAKDIMHGGHVTYILPKPIFTMVAKWAAIFLVIGLFITAVDFISKF